MGKAEEAKEVEVERVEARKEVGRCWYVRACGNAEHVERDPFCRGGAVSLATGRDRPGPGWWKKCGRGGWYVRGGEWTWEAWTVGWLGRA